MNAPLPPLVADEAAIRELVKIIQSRAAHAFRSIDRTGDLQLSQMHPASNTITPILRFGTGDDIERVVQAILVAATTGHNVYIEGRTIVRGAPRRGLREHT